MPVNPINIFEIKNRIDNETHPDMYKEDSSIFLGWSPITHGLQSYTTEKAGKILVEKSIKTAVDEVDKIKDSGEVLFMPILGGAISVYEGSNFHLLEERGTVIPGYIETFKSFSENDTFALSKSTSKNFKTVVLMDESIGSGNTIAFALYNLLEKFPDIKNVIIVSSMQNSIVSSKTKTVYVVPSSLTCCCSKLKKYYTGFVNSNKIGDQSFEDIFWFWYTLALISDKMNNGDDDIIKEYLPLLSRSKWNAANKNLIYKVVLKSHEIRKSISDKLNYLKVHAELNAFEFDKLLQEHNLVLYNKRFKSPNYLKSIGYHGLFGSDISLLPVPSLNKKLKREVEQKDIIVVPYKVTKNDGTVKTSITGPMRIYEENEYLKERSKKYNNFFVKCLKYIGRFFSNDEKRINAIFMEIIEDEDGNYKVKNSFPVRRYKHNLCNFASVLLFHNDCEKDELLKIRSCVDIALSKISDDACNHNTCKINILNDELINEDYVHDDLYEFDHALGFNVHEILPPFDSDLLQHNSSYV